MAFPSTPLDFSVELDLAGTWTDITSDVYVRDPVSLTRGRQDESATADPSKLSFTLNNRDGRYAPRNPASPLYGKIGRNTPVRVRFPGGASEYIQLPQGDSTEGYVSTPDHASLDISGNLDVRVDARADTWENLDDFTVLIAKGADGGSDHSWSLYQYGLTLVFRWTLTTGTSYAVQADLLGLATERNCFCAVVLPNNGDGTHTAAIYRGATINGPWTQMALVTEAGAGAIRNSAGPVTMGTADPAGSTWLNFYEGQLYGMQVRNGVDGTPVIDMDVSQIPVGASSWTDDTGRTWTKNGAVQIPDTVNARFVGEISSWPSRWEVSGNDAWVPIEAGGLMRRLGQGAKAAESPIRRSILKKDFLAAYWPMEDVASTDDQKTFSSVPGATTALRTSGFTYSADDSLPGSAALPTVADGAVLRAEVPALAAPGNGWAVSFWVKPTGALGATQTLLWWKTVGGSPYGMYQLKLGIDDTTYTLTAKDAEGDNEVTLYTEARVETWSDVWNLVVVTAQQIGTSTEYVVAAGPWGDLGFLGGVTKTTTKPGRVNEVRNNFAGTDGMGFGHLSVWADYGGGIGYGHAGTSFSRETAGARIVRLAGESHVPIDFIGEPSDTPRMGGQPVTAMLDVMQDAATTDGGMLTEQLTGLALLYRTRRSMYNQAPSLVLDYTRRGDIPPGLEPTEDDQATRNDVTVSRLDGGFARVTRDDGPLSINPPPLGVGTYDEEVTLNLYDGEDCADQASWSVHLGTWDEARFPTISLNLAAAPHLIPEFLALRLLDKVRIINPPAWLSQGPIDLIVQGYREDMGPYTWTAELNCSPAGPYDVAVTGDSADTEGSVLASSATSTATTISVSTTDGPVWTNDAGSMPLSIIVAGEAMTVTAISGTSSPQTFTVTRHTNGVVKAQSAGADVRLAHSPIVAL